MEEWLLKAGMVLFATAIFLAVYFWQERKHEKLLWGKHSEEMAELTKRDILKRWEMLSSEHRADLLEKLTAAQK